MKLTMRNLKLGTFTELSVDKLDPSLDAGRAGSEPAFAAVAWGVGGRRAL
jgi:hypothetical protein